MAKSRLIPKLQLRFSEYNKSALVLVITKQFNEVTEIGDPVSQAKIFQDQAADELIFININPTNRDEIPLLAGVINRVAQEIFMPLTVGGGVDCLTDFKALLANGADKVCLNTAALLDPDLITKAAEKYGSQCVVASIDFKCDDGKDYFVYTHGGRRRTSMHPVECAMQAEKIGAGELLLTSIDHDGTKQGLNLEICKMISEHVSIPIINSGGCGLARHFIDGFLVGRANAIAAGSFFAHRDQNFMQTRSHIINAGVNIRYHR